jgi:hypothetical protein
MNYHIKKNVWNLMLAMLCCILVWTSCDKPLKSEGDMIAGEKAVLSIDVLGTSEDEASSPILSLSNKKARIQSDVPVSKEIVSHEEGFDSRIRLFDGDYHADGIVHREPAYGGKSAVVSAVRLPKDIFYYYAIYKKTDNSVVASGAIRSGSPVHIPVETNTDYKWVAFSYNTNRIADFPTYINPRNLVVPMGNNLDFLHASGEIRTNELVTPLGIVFKHKMARIGVEINTMGMFADIEQISLSNNQMRTANFDVFNGDIQQSSLVTQPEILLSRFERIPNYNYDDRKIAYLYTADATKLANFEVKLTGISIKLDPYATAAGQPRRSFSNMRKYFNSTDLQPVLGGSKIFAIDLIESPIYTLSSGVKVETYWARANLYYAGASDHNPYRFHHLNQQTQDPNTFFSFAGILSQVYGELYPNQGDPCELVYPQGTWRTALYRDYQGLVGDENGVIAQKPTLVNGAYIEYPTSGSETAYPTNNLRFNFNGYATGSTLTNGLIDLNFTSYGNKASIWSSTIFPSIIPQGAPGAIHYEGSSSSRVKPETVSYKVDVSPFPGLAGGADVAKTTFMNIRCVRH